MAPDPLLGAEDVTFPRGFRAWGWQGGPHLKMALIWSDREAAVAGRFTTNAARAAPVTVSQEVVRGGKSRGVIVNAGNANALTGEAGRRDALEMQRRCAERLGVAPHLVAVASTGVIGVLMPMEQIREGIDRLAEWAQGGTAGGTLSAAEAILTTDTCPKTASIEVRLSRGVVRIGAIAKGAGMIHPQMATMLVFITTDAAIAPQALDGLLGEATDNSFHGLSVDGDMSTNDTVLLWANGASGVELATTEDRESFQAALTRVARHLARQIAADGEGARHLITVRLSGARTVEDARQKARAVVRSNLVKSAVYGQDANWGRVLAAVGSVGEPWDPEKASLFMNGLALYRRGRPEPFDEAAARRVMGSWEVVFEVELGEGTASAEAWGCDLTEGYVDINAHYRS
ncbi:MAG: bifunctional glutamate N-acetyltransferase/amino-acid acetyltransferase ArgJ [Firmicutes bacterium]|nr:bifunctional glutamate N-acetyltransferase/amino-acid acetyltransferase ArgJ [Bacillota bacterium]